MLKTNSKKARENVRAYITSNIDADLKGATFEETAAYIMDEFKDWYQRGNYQEQFLQFSYCLPFGLFCYHAPTEEYNALDIVAQILEETPEEAARFTEEKADELLTYLIYKEVAI